ncbi:ImmA/IrrE family metallo-endopeptidase [[Flexibacter] sp. ATCC 35208]|uniref:ImmA/IrrE family metallo-endopeptidase n=1 Tax=[Flexibacter] sp. ATCC 35208 TaxID=1936242 RepID=UPI001180E466|nr:hypothetical protein [[Flexibacter] sp. ATCC 35208]
MDSVIISAVKVAGLKEQIFINQPFDPSADADNGLHFFVTSPQTEPVTNCERGNAVYDAITKSVFIDISLLDHSLWMNYAPQLGSEVLEEDMPFLKVYLSFVLLHELGHHALHHGSAGNLSYTNGGNKEFRQKEKDADQFAFTVFGKLLKDNAMIQRKASAMIDITLDSATQEENAAISILSMAETILLCMQYGLSPYSQFYADQSHPSYLDRIHGMADEITTSQNIRPDIIVKAIQLKKTIEVTKSIQQQYAVSEITLFTGILDASFSDKGLCFISTKFNGHTEIPFFKANSAPNNLRQYTELPDDFFPFTAPLDSNSSIDLFSIAGVGTYCLLKGTDQLYAVEKNHFRKLPTDTFNRAFAVPGTVVYGTLPANFVYISTSEEIKSVSAKGVVIVNRQQLAQAIALQHNLTEVKIDQFDMLVNGNYVGIYFSAMADTISRIGYLILEGRNLQIKKSIVFDLPQNFFASNEYGNELNKGENMLLFSLADSLDIYITTTEKTNTYNISWLLWKIDNNGSPRMLKKFDFLSKEAAHQKWYHPKSPYLYKERYCTIGNDLFIVNWSNDLCYLMDLKKEVVKPAFYPGDEEQKIKGGGNGKALYFMQGTKRCYLIDYSQTK